MAAGRGLFLKKNLSIDFAMTTEAEMIRKISGATLELAKDLWSAVELTRARDGDPFSQRVLIRTVFSYFEGEVASLRSVVVEVVEAYFRGVLSGHDKLTDAMEAELNVSLSTKDYFAAINRNYQDFKDGIANPRETRLCLEKAIKEVFRVHGQVFRHDFAPDFRGEGWEAFLKLKQKRNRITHAATAEDYEVTEEDGKMAEVVALWVGQFFDAANNAAVQKMKNCARRMGIRPEDL